MQKNIKGANINYIDYGLTEGQVIVLLHGWGQNIAMMKPLGDLFSKQNRIIIIDLPGFGGSEEPAFPWAISDYVETVHDLLMEIDVVEPIIFGHSFGGKIALLYASKYDVKQLIVCGSPFKVEIEKLSTKTKILKTLKKVPGINLFANIAKKHIGSEDYRKASPTMREILVNNINLDIRENVKLIKSPTLIIWGDLDEAVSVDLAYELEDLIEDAGVVVYEGATHYVYLERLKEVEKVLRTFIES